MNCLIRYIFTWNLWDNTTWFITWVVLPTWPSWNWTQDNLRQLYLSNWEVIWDFIWNLWEVVSPTNLADWSNEYYSLLYNYQTYLSWYTISWITNNTYTFWQDITDNNFKDLFWPKTTTATWAWMWKLHNMLSIVLNIIYFDENMIEQYDKAIIYFFKVSFI